MKIKRFVKYVGFKTKEHAPEILIGAGIIGGVASAVIACKATMKLPELKEERDQMLKDIEDVCEIRDCGELPEDTTYTEEDEKNDTKLANRNYAVKCVRLYLPAIALGTLSATSILVGGNILRKDKLALVSAYNVAQKELSDYRERVVNKFGKAVDNEMRFGIKETEVEEETIDEETGEKKVTRRTVRTYDADPSGNLMFFDESSPMFSRFPEDNLNTLRRIEDECKFIIEHDGYITLNTVRNKMGLPDCKRGAILGWVDDPSLPEFSLNIYSEANMDFINGFEPYGVIDPTPHGVLADLLKIRY